MSAVDPRILFLRPDTYGDLVLFEPVLRLVRERWPSAEIGVVIRESYTDLSPLIAVADVRWIATACNPYAAGPRDAQEAFAALIEKVREFAPDCIVAACFDKTWFEPTVASFFPNARQVILGEEGFDVWTRVVVETLRTVEWAALYPETVPAEQGSLDRDKNLRLAEALTGTEALPVRPRLNVPLAIAQRARDFLEGVGLHAGEFAVCAPAGTANVQIKSWPAARYGEVLAWLERDRGIRSLLIGHQNEAETLEEARDVAKANGASPALWLGGTGEIAMVAALAQAARFYLGNDTGPLHIAAAVECPTVSIFGGGHWPRFKPAARRSGVVVQPLPCFGCGWNCLFGYAPCVREIPVQSVRDAIEWLLSSDEDGEREFTVKDALDSAGPRIVAGAAAARDLNGAVAAGKNAVRSDATTAAALLQQLERSEADRAARQQVIEKQGVEIVRLQAEVERWLQEADGLWPRLKDAENARNLLAAQIEDLRAHFATSEADRAARQQVIEEQGAEVARLHAEVKRWLQEASELWPRLNEAENARNLLAAQLENLRAHFMTSEADRAARQRVIEEQGAEIVRLQAEVDRWLREAGELWPRLNAAENARNLLAAQLEDLQSHFDKSEADRAARLSIIEEQRAERGKLVADLEVLRAQLRVVDEHWSSWLTARRRRERP